jgi:site-specific recombinase XerD
MKPRVRRSPPRAFAEGDRARIGAEARSWAATGSFLALRTRALLLLGLCSALRTKELLALDLDQVVEATGPGRRYRVRSSGHLRAPQSKGRRKGAKQWDSAGMFIIGKAARQALRDYIRAAAARGWLELPPKRGQPLFIANKNLDGGHYRISRRTAQYAWTKLQKRAGLLEREQRYGLHCLRHEAISQVAHASKDPHVVAAYGRFGLQTALRYVHTNPIAIAAIAESVN